MSDERIDYVVSLVDCKLANNQPAIGYFAPSAIDHRFDLTFDEMIADCTLFRNIGNEMFKLKDFSSALTNYKKCVDVLGHVPAGLTLPQRELLRDGVVKALSNTAQCYLSQPEPDYAAAKHMASEVRGALLRWLARCEDGGCETRRWLMPRCNLRLSTARSLSHIFRFRLFLFASALSSSRSLHCGVCCICRAF